MRVFKLLGFVALLLLVFLIYNEWFTNGLLSGGDLQVYFREMFVSFSFFPPPSWSWTLGAGLGVNNSSLLWNYVAVQMPIAVLGNLFGFPWEVIQRLGFLFPYLILSLVLPYYFIRKFLPFAYTLLGLLVFSFNTYILMLVAGGQIFLSLAYVLMPSIFYYFYLLFSDIDSQTNKRKIQVFCLSTLLFSFQVLLDVRIAYVTLLLIFLLMVIRFFSLRNYKRFIYFPLVLICTGLIHFFWLLPTILVKQNPLSGFGEEYVSSGIVDFLSFAKFENTISLLHPNWPENIFGKTYFIKPEFLVLPIIAFSSLLFLKKEKKEVKFLILFFGTISLVGSFLAKGTSEPFGNAYIWMFKNIPGFMMFRDPTKWYSLVAISYSFLIPFTVMSVGKFLNSMEHKKKSFFFKFQNIFLLAVFSFFIFLIFPAWSGGLGGVLKSSRVPEDYIKLKEFLAKDKEFYRTFWIPRTSTFSYYSVIHPITTGYDFVREYSSDKIINTLMENNLEGILQKISVKYVIIPSDTERKIFLKDRTYDESSYKKAIKQLSEVSFLTEVMGFGKIKVFEVSSPLGHIWSLKKSLVSEFKFVSPTRYYVSVKNANKGDEIVLSENYDRNWIARNNKFGVRSFPVKVASGEKFKDRKLNGFVLPEKGDYVFEIYYTVEDWVMVGLIISGVSLIGIISIFVWSSKK